jgi:hypothetical protein
MDVREQVDLDAARKIKAALDGGVDEGRVFDVDHR